MLTIVCQHTIVIFRVVSRCCAIPATSTGVIFSAPWQCLPDIRSPSWFILAGGSPSSAVLLAALPGVFGQITAHFPNKSW